MSQGIKMGHCGLCDKLLGVRFSSIRRDNKWYSICPACQRLMAEPYDHSSTVTHGWAELWKAMGLVIPETDKTPRTSTWIRSA